MLEKLSISSLMFFPFIVLDVGDFGHMMGMMDWDYMMGWWGIPNIGVWWIAVWSVQFLLAFMVFRDAEKKNKNSLLWFILVIIPWAGFLFLLGYLVIRGEEVDTEEAFYDAQKVLDERYAKGEITRKEYLQIKKDIEKWRESNG